MNLEETAEVVNFDPKGLTVKQKWPIPGCKTPTGLALDRADNRLFIGCRSRVLAVMDARSALTQAETAIAIATSLHL